VQIVEQESLPLELSFLAEVDQVSNWLTCDSPGALASAKGLGCGT
jgi:hypothetical protein